MGYASEYRSQAVECCRLARTAVAPEHQKILMRMAAMLLTLAKRRETMDQAAAVNSVREAISTNKVAALADKVVALKRYKASPTGEAAKATSL